MKSEFNKHLSKFSFMFFLVVILLFLFCESCSSDLSQKSASDNNLSAQSNDLQLNIDYTIINIEKGTPATPKKCIIDVRLAEIIQEEDIKQIAENIKNNEGAKCEPLFIYYFVGNDQPGIDAAWAYSNYSPNLEININGMTIAEKSTLEADLHNQDMVYDEQNVIGSWLCSYGFTYTAVLKKEDDTYTIITKYSDGSGETKPLYLNIINGENRLFENPGVSTGTYLLIEQNGNLGYFDNQGLIFDCSIVE